MSAPVLPAADVLVLAIMERDSIEPGYAVAVVRGVVRLMSTADALAVIGTPPKPKPQPGGVDVRSLIG